MNSDHSYRLTIQIRNPSYYSRIIPEISVSMHLHEFIKNIIHVVNRCQSSYLPCCAYFIPYFIWLRFCLTLLHKLCRFITVILMKWIKIIISIKRLMNVEYLIERHFQAFTLNYHINKSVFKLELCPLETFRQLLSYGLLNNSWSCKSNKCFWLGEDYISKHCKACCNASGCRICKNRNV